MFLHKEYISIPSRASNEKNNYHDSDSEFNIENKKLRSKLFK